MAGEEDECQRAGAGGASDQSRPLDCVFGGREFSVEWATGRRYGELALLAGESLHLGFVLGIISLIL